MNFEYYAVLSWLNTVCHHNECDCAIQTQTCYKAYKRKKRIQKLNVLVELVLKSH